MDNNTANIVITQFTSSAVIVWTMQKLKNASWFPFLQHGEAKISRFASIFLAGLTTIGISYTWNPTTRVLATAIPTLPAAIHGAWHWLSQYCANEVLYQATVNKVSITHAPQGQVVPAEVAAGGALVVPPDKPKV